MSTRRQYSIDGRRVVLSRVGLESSIGQGTGREAAHCASRLDARTGTVLAALPRTSEPVAITLKLGENRTPAEDLERAMPSIAHARPEADRIDFLLHRDGYAATHAWVERTLNIYRDARAAYHGADYAPLFEKSICEFEQWLAENPEGRTAGA